jgi:hypothetical protein
MPRSVIKGRERPDTVTTRIANRVRYIKAKGKHEPSWAGRTTCPASRNLPTTGPDGCGHSAYGGVRCGYEGLAQRC